MKILFVGNFVLEYQRVIKGCKIHVFLKERKSSEYEQSGERIMVQISLKWQAYVSVGHSKSAKEMGLGTWSLEVKHSIRPSIWLSVRYKYWNTVTSPLSGIWDGKFWSLLPAQLCKCTLRIPRYTSERKLVNPTVLTNVFYISKTVSGARTLYALLQTE